MHIKFRTLLSKAWKFVGFLRNLSVASSTMKLIMAHSIREASSRFSPAFNIPRICSSRYVSPYTLGVCKCLNLKVIK